MSVQEGCENLIDRSADEPDHLYVGGVQRGFERRRNRTTNEDVGTELQEFANPSHDVGSGQSPFLSLPLPPVLDVDE
jgi:hypothetical protein